MKDTLDTTEEIWSGFTRYVASLVFIDYCRRQTSGLTPEEFARALLKAFREKVKEESKAELDKLLAEQGSGIFREVLERELKPIQESTDKALDKLEETMLGCLKMPDVSKPVPPDHKKTVNAHDSE